MIGRTLGHYEILGLVGRGGMGEVYRARDLKLKRDVALKILHPELALDATALKRFRREAELVAGLNHPHIVMVHSVEEEEGVHFITMELLEGQPLDRIRRSEGVPLAQLFEVGIAIADALAAAHQSGIVHRDLKPANVMLTRAGQIKVLDFGVAKLAENYPISDEQTTIAMGLTRQGFVLGTVPYMSPEQLRGQEVDPRSDIFSLGILLYELASGRRPFDGSTNADVTSSILQQPAESLAQLKPSLPRHFTRIVMHCLEKDPEERAQSAKDIRNELRGLRKEIESESGQASRPAADTVSANTKARPTAPSKVGIKARWIGLGTAVLALGALAIFLKPWDKDFEDGPPAMAFDERKSIAVLPFADMSPEKDQEYFSDGISEELLNVLAKIPQLRVISRSSAFSFKGKNVELPEIARVLNVDHVLEGSVRRSGNQIRITAQLIDARSDSHLWSQTYDRQFDEVFAIQDEIAAEVVRQLRVTLLGEVPRVRRTQPEAYALLLQAGRVASEGSEEGFAQSDDLLRRALEIDPRYAPAWKAVALLLTNRVTLGLMSTDEAYPRAREAIKKAIEIDPNYAAAHMILGGLDAHPNYDLAAWARHVERALAIDPMDPDVLGSAAAVLGVLDRLDETILLTERVVESDPLNPIPRYNLGNWQICNGQLDAGIASLRMAAQMNPRGGLIRFVLAQAFLLKGDAESALKEIEQETSSIWRMIGFPLVYQALGRMAESDAAISELIAKHEKERSYYIGAIYAMRGDRDQAFYWLEKAIQNKDYALNELPIEPFFDNLHSDTRWVPLLRKLGKAPDQLAAISFNVTLPQ